MAIDPLLTGRGYYHTTFNRERQIMQFAKAGDDCEPKSLRGREDGSSLLLGMLLFTNTREFPENP